MKIATLTFLNEVDNISKTINDRANVLYQKLQNIQPHHFEVKDEYISYFFKHHLGQRLQFSISSSAAIIHNSIIETGQQDISKIVFVDYGAGLGTLYLLAGLCNFKATIYNDFDGNWTNAAARLTKELDIPISYFITGTIEDVDTILRNNSILADIIASRNVLEHIYDIKDYHVKIFKHNPKAIVYSTTTANYQNLAMRYLHRYIHYKAEKSYLLNQRINIITKKYPHLNDSEIRKIAKFTRGTALADFEIKVNEYLKGKTIEKQKDSNTCDCETGLWIEHLMSEKEYLQIAIAGDFKFVFQPGFWDTNYRNYLINVFTCMLNKMILSFSRKNAIKISPFICVIARK
jgi:hypothetical protein